MVSRKKQNLGARKRSPAFLAVTLAGALSSVATVALLQTGGAQPVESPINKPRCCKNAQGGCQTSKGRQVGKVC